MSDRNDTPAIDVEEVLNRVGDPEAFITQLREARKERQLRRNIFIENLSPEVKAEWINGEAVYHSPAKESHNATTSGLMQLLTNYDSFVERIYVRAEKAMIEAGEHNFEPDVCIWVAEDHTFSPDTMIYPRPDIAVEVLSPRTEGRDLGVKKREYARAGTAEYWVVDAIEWTLLQFVNVDGAFEEHRTFREGDDFVSVELPRLAFPLTAIWDWDLRKATSRAWVLADKSS